MPKKIIYSHELIVDGKSLTKWSGKRIPKWIKKLRTLKGVEVVTTTIQT